MTTLDFEETWEKFSNVPINNNDQIEESFLHFEAGSSRFEVWHWFEENFDIRVIDHLCLGSQE